MKLHNLPTIVNKPKRRVGRGGGSTKGFHVAGRGQKGQKSRSKVPLWFEGGQLPLSKRIPFLRGKDRFKSVKVQPVTVNLDQLNTLPADTTVTKQVLVDNGMLSLREAAEQPVKVLGRGDLKVKLTFQDILVSESAAAKIKKAGGTIENKGS